MYMILLETVRHVNVTYNLGDLADWVSALGTVAAVVVSLYLANRRDKPQILITFTDTKQNNCRITNKSFQPVELRIKLPGEKHYVSFPLPPRDKKIRSMKDDQPFNNDIMCFNFSPKDKAFLYSSGLDIASNSKYYFIFYMKNNHWWIKQYNFRAFWLVARLWRGFNARIQKSKWCKLVK